MALRAPEVERLHLRPGQYVRVTIDGEENPYALANEPGAPLVELLFKKETALTETMAALREGDALLVGPPEGRGFPVEEHEGRDLILCAAGSGIAPLRAVLRTVLPRRARYGAMTLFYGQREASEFAYGAEQEAWRAAGVEVVLVMSDRGDGRGVRGRVQDQVAARRPAVAQAVAYVAGMSAMITGVHDALRELGLPEGRMFLNY
jgi:sulfhydrogenase subunit gamma (sulfur reductase)